MKTILSILLFFLTTIYAKAQLPSVVLTDIQGNSVKVDALENEGHPIIIDFFATWCKPCIRELSAIADVYEDWQKETGVKLVAISIDKAQDAGKVKLLVNENEWPYETVLLDKNSELKQALSIQMIPYTLVIDGKGKIVYRHYGYTDGEEEELLEIIKKSESSKSNKL